MIDTAIDVLARDGYQGTSFSAVLAASGAPRGSIYYHFPGGKDQLVDAALHRQFNRVLGVLDRLAGLPADRVVDGFVGAWRRGLEATDLAVGCSLVAVTTSAPAQLRETAGVLFRRWREELARLFVQGGVPAPAAGAFAAEVLAATEGAVIIARAEHSLEALDLVAERLRIQARELSHR